MPATYDVLRNTMVPMRDGVRLATDLYLPARGRPVPVIVERTGYNKDTSPIHWTKSPDFFAAHGYAVAVQDVRGIHASEGCYYPWRDDGWGTLQDGYDTVEWLAAQEWCDGKVGMFGGSYSGATQLRAAIARPPHLKALVVRQAPNNPLVSVRPNGVTQLTGGGTWVVDQARQALLQAERRLREIEDGDSEFFFNAFPDARFDDQLAWARDFLSHDADSNFWREFDVVPHADQIEVPILHLGGWHDLHRRSTIAMHHACIENSAAADDQRLVMGPWIHGSRTHSEESGRYVGEIDMGPQAQLDLNALMLRWFDHWLRDEDDSIMTDLPPVSYFLMGARTWLEADEWPPTGAQPLTLFASGSQLVSDAPTERTTRTFVDQRSDPARTVGGDAVLLEWEGAREANLDPGAEASANRAIQRGPHDQHSQESKGLTFTTDPLEDDLCLAGPITATIHAAVESDTQPADSCLIVRLTEVHADGRSIDIVDGSCRMAPSVRTVSPTTVDLGDTAILIPAGHRLRLGVFASNFPRVPRRVESDHADLQIAVHTGPHTPTSVELTVVSSASTATRTTEHAVRRHTWRGDRQIVTLTDQKGEV